MRKSIQPMLARWFVALPVVLVCAAGCQDKQSQSTEAPAAAAVVANADDAAIRALLDFIDARKNQIGPTGKINTENPNWKVSLPKPPEVQFTAGKTYFWHLQTNKGPIKIRLMQDVAPKHVASTIYLTLLGFYDGLTFHRVIPGFMAQGGDPLGNGSGNPGYRYAGEFRADVVHDRPGLLSMANAGPGTDGSQFFLTFTPRSNLNGKHTIFGELVGDESMKSLKQLERFGTPRGPTTVPLNIEQATISVE